MTGPVGIAIGAATNAATTAAMSAANASRACDPMTWADVAVGLGIGVIAVALCIGIAELVLRKQW